MVDHPVLCAVQVCDVFVGFPKGFVDAGIFDGQCHHVGNGAHQIHIGLVKGTAALVDDAQHPDHPVRDMDGDIQHAVCLHVGLVVHRLKKCGLFDVSLTIMGLPVR